VPTTLKKKNSDASVSPSAETKSTTPPSAVSTKTANLATAKILLNSVLSRPGAKYMTGDLKDFYLKTPMEHYEYVRLPIEVIPPISIIEHNLLSLVHKGYIYAEVRRGMYGLPQAGRIVANNQITAFLAPKGYTPVSPSLWRHNKSNLAFTLVIDNFGIKYTNPQDVHDLMTTPSRSSIKLVKTGRVYDIAA
jgi:hypothetical protein